MRRKLLIVSTRLPQAFAIGIMILSMTHFTQAQVTGVTMDQAPPIPGAGHDYIHLLSETVNPSVGSVSVRISLPVPRGRELTVPFAFGYDSNAAHHFIPPGSALNARIDNHSYLGQGGWTYLVPQLNMIYNVYTAYPPQQSPPQISKCAYYTDYVFTDLSGGTHSLNISASQVASGGTCIGGYGKPNRLNGGDTRLQAVTESLGSGNWASPVTIAELDGTTYYFSNGHVRSFGDTQDPSRSSLPDWIETRNGNQAVINDVGNGAFSVTDTAGRTAFSSSGFGQTGNTISISGLANPYTLTWENRGSSWSFSSYVNRATGSLCSSASQPNMTLPEVTAIQLPNGQSYQFEYDPVAGLLSKIIYPTGGYVRYVWGTNSLSDSMTFPDTRGNSGCQTIHDDQAITNRYVSFDGVNEVLEQDFSYSTTWTPPNWSQTWTGKSTTVVTKDLVRGTSFNTVYTYVPGGVPATQPNDAIGFGGGVFALEKTITYYDTTGALLRTVTKDFCDPQLPPDETVSLENGQTSKIQHAYINALTSTPAGCSSSGYPPPTIESDEYEYDYGAGAPGNLLRHIHTDYATFAATPLFPAGPSILDRPLKVVTNDGTGIGVAETDYAYDETAVSGATAGGVEISPTGHDDTNYGKTYNNRGNATTVTRKCFPGCSDAITKYSYDVTGQILSMVDPDGNATGAVADNHKTIYQYDDQFSDGNPRNTNAYLTKISRPLALAQSFTYDYNDGQLTNSFDENGLEIRYTYADSLRRLTRTQSLSGANTTGQTDISYDDVARTVTTTKKITSGVSLTTVSVIDGLGHLTQTQLTTDPEGTTYTDTTYDGMGRVWKRSNPHRGSSTNDKTTFTYDALGRVKQVQQPDGSIVTTDYNGNCTTVTDEASKKRRSCTDGLGRLVRVEEPGATGAPPSAGTGSISLTGAEQAPVQVLVTPAQSGSGSLQIGTGPVQWKSVSNASTGGTTSIAVNGTEQQYPAGVISGTVDIGLSGTEQVAPATYATGSIAFNGNEQSKLVQTQGATQAIGSVTIGGNEAVWWNPDPNCIWDPNPCGMVPTYDSGTVRITVNGHPEEVGYDQNSDLQNVPMALASAFQNDPASPVDSWWSPDSVVNFRARQYGSGPNGWSISCSSASSFGGSGSFYASSCGPTLGGGQDPQYVTIYDSGNATIAVNGHSYSIGWGAGATPNSIASALASNINGDPGAVVTASVSVGTVSLYAKNPGATGNTIPISCSASYDSGNFGRPSFGCTASAATLTGGRDALYDSGTLSLTVNNHTTSPASTWGFGSTPQTIATDLVTKVMADSARFADAGTPNSPTTVKVTAKTKGSISNYPYSVQVSDAGANWPIPIFNTGVGSNGLPGADGAVDTHYTLVSSADASATGPNTYISNSNAGPIGAWLANGPNSKWLAPLSNAGAALNPGTYRYRTTFDLTGLDRTTAVLQGRWGADNSGYIQLNGVTVPNTSISGFGTLTAFTINSGFVAGVNTLDFVVTNGGSGGNPTGVRIEISGNAVRTLPSFAANPPGPANLAGGWPDASAVDHGTMTVTVNGHNYQVNWGQSDNEASIATNLVSALAADTSVNPSRSGNTVYINPKQAGTSYSFSTAFTWDSSNFTQSSFSNANQISDYGTVGISITGQSDTVPWAGADTAASIARALRDKINADPAHKLSATVPSSIPADPTTVTLSLTATGTGNSTNYTVTPSRTYDTAHFTSASFTNPSAATLMAGGKDPVYNTVYDSGTIAAYVNGFGTSLRYQQGSTASSLFTAFVNKFSDPVSPVNISVAGSTINFTAKEPGADSNYPIDISYSPDQPSLFPQNSFNISRSNPTLTGGAYQVLDLAAPSATLYTYDGLNNLTCAVQKGQDTATFTDCASASANWRPRSFIYNSLSRLTSATNPESGTISYSYDQNGNILSKTSPKPNQGDPNTKQVITYCYDSLNRLTAKGYGVQSCPLTTPAATYVYDQATYNGLSIGNPKGRRVGMSDASGQTAWSLDLTTGVGWMTTEKRTINGVTKNIVAQSNLDGSIASITYPSGRVITYTPGGAGRALEAKETANTINYVTAATYAPFGAVSGMTNGNSITVSNSYNNRLQPTTLSATAPSATILSLSYDFHLGSGDNGNVYQIVNNRDGNRTQNFSYDELNRIQAAWTSGPNWGDSFTIDAYANLTNRGPVAGKTNYEPLDAAPANTKNQLTGFGHDAAGNLTQNGSATYTYDEENRISSAGGVTYTYDGDGNRVMKSSGTLFWGDGPLAESDLLGNMQSEYIFFNAKRVARRDVSSNSVHYYFSDHLGSTSLITNSTGSTFEQDTDYFPFGGIAQGATADHYLFTGKERDSETSLDFFGARFYANQMGRWMSPDWSEAPEPVPYADLTDPQSLNLYGYVRNNPLNSVDMAGHQGAMIGAVRVSKTDPCNGIPNCVFVTADPPKVPLIWQIYYETRLYRWASQASQKLDKHLERWYQAMQNVSSLLTPCGRYAAEFECGTVFPVEIAPLEEGAASEYINITRGASVKNISTNVTATEFGANLEANGFAKSTAADGTPTYTKGSTQYTVYSSSRSTGGPTAQVKINGEVVAKIRLR